MQMQRWLITVATLAIVAAAAFGLFALYCAVYWGWVTATPLTPDQLDRARYNAFAWFWLFVGSETIVFIATFVWMVASRRKRAPQRSLDSARGR